MTASRTWTRTLAATALFSAGAAQAQIVMYTDLATWQAAVTQADHDYFADMVPGPLAVPNLDRQTVGSSYTYTVHTQNSATFDGLHVAGNPVFKRMSTASPDGDLYVSLPTQRMTAVGLFALASTQGNDFVPGGMMTVTACNLVASTGCISDSYATGSGSDFRGFISAAGISYVMVSSDNLVHPSITALHLAAAVPEPGSYALLLAGLAGLAWVSRRRAS